MANEALDRVGWKLFGGFTRAHVAVYRATGGRIGANFFRRAPCCLVDHVGARSGQRRTTPLIYARDGDDVVIVASKGGHQRHPAWLHNLRANPETTVQVGGERWPVRAREATEPERERLWPRLTSIWPAYDDYQQKTERKIPLVILERRPD